MSNKETNFTTKLWNFFFEKQAEATGLLEWTWCVGCMATFLIVIAITVYYDRQQMNAVFGGRLQLSEACWNQLTVAVRILGKLKRRSAAYKMTGQNKRSPNAENTGIDTCDKEIARQMSCDPDKAKLSTEPTLAKLEAKDNLPEWCRNMMRPVPRGMHGKFVHRRRHTITVIRRIECESRLDASAESATGKTSDEKSQGTNNNQAEPVTTEKSAEKDKKKPVGRAKLGKLRAKSGGRPADKPPRFILYV